MLTFRITCPVLHFVLNLMRPELNNVLQCLSHNGYSVLSLIGDILSRGSNREDRRIQCFLEGVEQNAVDICAQLLNHNSTSTSVSAWALGVALPSQARREHCSRFTTGPPLSLPNGGAVPPSLSFGIASTPTNSLDNSSNVGKAQCTCSSYGVVPRTSSDL